jgi:hypothetical protein
VYNAPSVTYPVGRCAFQRWLWAGLLVIGVTVMLAWALYQPLTWSWYMAWLPLCAGCVGGWRAWQVHGVLQWQGETWVLWLKSSHAQNPWHGGELRLALDAQRVLLLQWTPTPDAQDGGLLTSDARVPRRTKWLWLAKENAPHLWQDLRRAVHAKSPVF